MTETFFIARSSTAAKWLACLAVGAGIFAILLFASRELAVAISGAVAMMAAFAVFDRSRHVRYEVGDRCLRIKGDIWKRDYALAALDISDASVIDLGASKELQPKWKLLGTSMPGYKSGEFSLRNGKTAVVFLSDESRVLRLSEAKGKTLLLSCTDPEGLLAALRREKGAQL